MADRKRIDNALITSVSAAGLKVLANGDEKEYEFSKYYSGEKLENLRPGLRISGAIYRDKFLSEVEVHDESAPAAAPEPEPKPDGDTELERIVRTSAANVAATILTTKGVPVHLKKLFQYSKWVEFALRNGFQSAMDELDKRAREYEESKARSASQEKEQKKQPETAAAK